VVAPGQQDCGPPLLPTPCGGGMAFGGVPSQPTGQSAGGQGQQVLRIAGQQDGGCFSEGKTAAWDYKYVGSGRGGYDQVHTYKYVSEHGGDWEMEVTTKPYGFRLPTWLIAIAAIASCSAACYLLYTLYERTYGPIPIHHIYDCKDGTPEASWSHGKKAYCCATHQLGCSHVFRHIYDCQAGTPEVWSHGQKAYCCATAQKGCSNPLDHIGHIYDCKAGTPEEWGHGQKAYCCATSQLGCDGILPKYDCYSGDDEAAWDTLKRTWCCARYSKGCHNGETNTVPFDCTVGITDVNAWAPPKKNYCCTKVNLGCPSVTAAAPGNVTTTSAAASAEITTTAPAVSGAAATTTTPATTTTLVTTTAAANAAV